MSEPQLSLDHSTFCSQNYHLNVQSTLNAMVMGVIMHFAFAIAKFLFISWAKGG